MEDLLEAHQKTKTKNVKQRKRERKELADEDDDVNRENGAMTNERQKFKNMDSSQKVFNEINEMKKMQYSKVSRNKDRSDYALVERVIDKKTEYLFQKWQQNKFLDSVHGCISAGKEANVYYAPRGVASESEKDFAIKIYKVETMVFRDREIYIDGEHRFRKGKTNILKFSRVF